MKPAVIVSFVGSLVLLAPGLALSQHSANGAASAGTAVPAGSTSSSGGSSSSGGGSTSSSGSGDSGSFPAADGHRSINANRTPNAANSAAHAHGVFTNYSQLSSTVPAFSRPRNGLPAIGVAVPRGSVPAPARGSSGGSDGLTYIDGSYNPWIYAYDGFAATPMFGIYDPFDLGFGYADSIRTVSTLSSDADGVLRLDVKPWKTDVFIDGDRAGSVDQFQGVFHKLRLEAGVHRVELRAAGYETVVVNVRIQPGETITYRGTLEKR